MSKVSIICPYDSQTNWLDLTLKSILLTQHDNFEIILVNGNLNDPQKVYLVLTELEKSAKIETIKIVDVNKLKSKSNYNIGHLLNIGLKASSGDIVIIQNRDCYYVGDMISIIASSLELNQQVVFPIFNVSTNNTVQTLREMTNPSRQDIYNKFNASGKFDSSVWTLHPNLPDSELYYCSASHRETLEIMGGFDTTYLTESYVWKDYALKINHVCKYERIILDPDMIGFVIQMYTETPKDALCDLTNNEAINIDSTRYNSKVDTLCSTFNFPRIVHFYWVGKLSFLNWIVALSFRKHHPAWQVNIYTSSKSVKKPWNSCEQKQIEFKDYFDRLGEIDNVNLIDYTPYIEKLGLDNLASVHQADILKHHFIKTYGGVWSDFDVLFVRNLEPIFSGCTGDIIFRCYEPGTNWFYYPVGCFIGNRDSIIFSKILQVQFNLKNGKFGPYEETYQVFGTRLYDAILENNFGTYPEKISKVCREYNIEFFQNVSYLSINWNELHLLYGTDIHKTISDKSFGIHYFNGDPQTRAYIERFNKETFKPRCTMDFLIQDYVKLL